MADPILSRPGADLGVMTTGDFTAQNRVNLMELWSGEILRAYDEMQGVNTLVRSKTLRGGKEYRFDVTGTAVAGYKKPGVSLRDAGEGLMNEMQSTKLLIKADYPIHAPVELDSLDDVLMHYDVRSDWTHQLVQALKNKEDRLLLQVLANAGSKAANIPGQTAAGDQVTVTGGASATSTAIINAIQGAQETLDGNNIPRDGRIAVIDVPTYWKLVRDGEIVHQDRSPGNGSIAQGTFDKVLGLNVFVTTHLPSGVIAAEGGQVGTEYAGTFDTHSLVFHKDCVGQVRVWDIMLGSEYSLEYDSWLIDAKMAWGAGILRPECMVELTNS